jgi:putative DNA primase/helicase
VDTDAATVTQKAKTMARLLFQQASQLADPALQKLVRRHALYSESQGAISAALLRAKSEPGMSISAAKLDQDRYLLNCLNGVVDLRTGELLDFRRDFYITKLCHVKYNAESIAERDCPRFLNFLHWAMGKTADMSEVPERVTRMVGYLQKSFGYSLTGDVSEKAAFICYGEKGNNGKTTLLTIFKTILCEYAAQLDINSLMTSKFTDNNVRADLAKLHGARFVITSEVDDGQRLSERLMKYLTAGMGEVTACRKFENPFEFQATHKIWMDCNYRPEIRGADEAIWGRLKCLPFLQRIAKDDPEIDKHLLDKILTEAEGVLAWAVRGAMRWAKDGGLGDPPEVEAAGLEWRDADDPLKGFFEECCELDPDYWVRCTDLTKAYQQWCKDNNETQLKSSWLSQRLELKGIKLNRSRRVSDAGKQARCWDGVRLRAM